MAFPLIKLKEVLTESKVEAPSSNSSKRIRVRLHAKGVEKRPEMNDKEGATKYYIRRAGQFVYGRQNLHKGAFGVIPPELDGFQSSSDIPSFDVAARCLPEWVDLFLKQGGYYLELSKLASGVGSQRISPSKFLSLEMPLPSIEQQRAILDQVEFYKVSQSQLLFELTHQQTLLKKLRQQILQEAIEGKLTADWRAKNPDVESASELLKRIAAEKAQLVKDKKIKAQKPLPPITDEEKPFELPQGWKWCRLEESGLFERGKSKHRPRNDPRLFEGGHYPFVQTGDVARSKKNGFKISTFSQRYNDFGLAQSRSWGKGTLCITIAANIAETGFLDLDACFPDSVVGFTSISGLTDPFYVKYFIDATREEIEKFAPATAQKNINLGIINMLSFPLPPLEEQKAIVNKVEKLFALCDQLETQITQNQGHAEQLMQAVLKEAFAHNSEAETESQNCTVSPQNPEVIGA